MNVHRNNKLRPPGMCEHVVIKMQVSSAYQTDVEIRKMGLRIFDSSNEKGAHGGDESRDDMS